MVLIAAKKRRDAFAHALVLGVFSSDPQDANYCGNYFYIYKEKGVDVFKHRSSFKLLLSPRSKNEIEKFKKRNHHGSHS